MHNIIHTTSLCPSFVPSSQSLTGSEGTQLERSDPCSENPSNLTPYAKGDAMNL